jgi:hypothetical protein
MPPRSGLHQANSGNRGILRLWGLRGVSNEATRALNRSTVGPESQGQGPMIGSDVRFPSCPWHLETGRRNAKERWSPNPGHRRRVLDFPMTFFVTSHTARERTDSLHPATTVSAMGASATSNQMELCTRGLLSARPPQARPQRAGSGEFLDVEKNAGGREPPGRNTRRHT